MAVSVSFKPCVLTASELFQLSAAIRYPHSSWPVANWIIRESVFITLLGGAVCMVAGFLGFEKYPPSHLALILVPLLLVIWAVYLIQGTRQAYRVNRASTDAYFIELSEDGVSCRGGDMEYRIRWKPSHGIDVTPCFILIRDAKATMLAIPRHSFASPESEDEFVGAGRQFQAAATNETTQENTPDVREDA